ncbi:hypothetical protein [Planosporangium mesophilum]|nr:hypothetical protein [Planosporangium mesophilum]
MADFVRMEDGQLREHCDIVEDEVTRENAARGLPVFGDVFPADR